MHATLEMGGVLDLLGSVGDAFSFLDPSGSLTPTHFKALTDRSSSLEECAHQLYDSVTFDTGLIGKFLDPLSNYNSVHQVIALAMAVKTAKMDPVAYFSKYLYEPAGMTQTSADPPNRPIASAYIISTLNDLTNFVHKLLTYELLPRDIVEELEKDSKNGGNQGTGWINGMGHHVNGSVHAWHGAATISIDRETQSYMVMFAPLWHYSFQLVIPWLGSRKYWDAAHRTISEILGENSDKEAL
jgi:hypothetical protein